MKIKYLNLMKELEKAHHYIEQKWPFQNNLGDYKTNFIYKLDKVSEVKDKIRQTGVNEIYTFHRWYNFHTSITCEALFVDNGCISNKDKKDKFIDLFIRDVPFDVKLTVYPRTINEKLDLSKRSEKNKLCDWFYRNQSQQQRKHLRNRLFIVCVAETYNDSLKLKSNFYLIENKIQQFLKYYSDKPFNNITYSESGRSYNMSTDIILVEENK